MEALPRVPASDVKRRGWRGVMWTLREEGAVLVTNHDRPEAVILTAAAYADFSTAPSSPNPASSLTWRSSAADSTTGSPPSRSRTPATGSAR